MKKAMMLIFVAALMIGFALPAQADHFKRGGYGREAHQCPVTDKLMTKAMFILENKDELGLTEEQITRIKGIKHEAKKAAIRQKAEMEILFLDIEGKMAEPKVDVAGINAMIDEGFASLSKTTKATVQSYADLKAVLTDEQMAKLKDLWWKKREK